MLALSGEFVLACGRQAAAAPVSAPESNSTVRPLRLLEKRFFFHTYEQDPLEKRLQRIELLVFGCTQPGGQPERLRRLSATIAERDRESASLQQYPAVSTLEWRVFKKTFPAKSLDDRLGRIETRLFGQDSPTMSYADRVDRLKRTLGVGTTAVNPSLPHRENFWFGNADQKQLSELFRQMNEQLEQMMKMSPDMQPHMEEFPTPLVPKKKSPSPPYNDPNSI